MKLILAFLFSGVTIVVASSNCTEEFQKCMIQSEYVAPSQPYMETEKDLMKLCKIFEPHYNCLFNYTKECGDEDLRENAKMHKKIFSLMCNKIDFKQKYLANARCLNKVQPLIGEKCRMEYGPEDGSISERCKSLNDFIRCNDDVVTKKCGDDARRVYDAISMTTFHFFVFRRFNCL